MSLMQKDMQLVREQEKGSALLEVLAALAMLAILTTTVLAIFTSTGLWISKAGNETAAANYAASILEDLRDQRGQLQAAEHMVPEDLGLDQQYKPGFPAGINAHISMEPMAGYSRLYKVEVLVNWNEGTELCEIKMATLIRKV